MLIEEVNAVRAESPKRPFDGKLDVVGLAVEGRVPITLTTVLGREVPGELGSDHDLVAEGGDGFAQDAFHSNGPYASAATKKVTPRSKARWRAQPRACTGAGLAIPPTSGAAARLPADSRKERRASVCLCSVAMS